MNVEIEGLALRPKRGWYCNKCDAVYFNPDDDNPHEDWHEGVDVLSMEWLKKWIQDAQDFGLSPDEIIEAILKRFIVE